MREGWTYKKLGEVATFINGYAFKPEQWKDSGTPIVRIQNLNNPEAPYNYYDGNGKQPPTLTFKVPENCFSGTYTVNLKAYFAIYLGGKLYDETSTSGTLVVQ